MKFSIYDWAGKCSNDIERMGFSVNRVIEGDMFKTAETLYNAGFSVMVVHGKTDGPIIWVDNNYQYFSLR